MSQHTFEFSRCSDDVPMYEDEKCNLIICDAAIKNIFGGKRRKTIRFTGSLTRGKVKGWVSVKPDSKRGFITVKRKRYEMHYDLERFLTDLGVINKRFYVKLEK